jgi:hypothetical protein
VVGSSAVLRLNFCAKNPPLRQAAKRWWLPQRKKTEQNFLENAIDSPCSSRCWTIFKSKTIFKMSQKSKKCNGPCGRVTVHQEFKDQSISGGKLIAGFLTGGVSLFATGVKKGSGWYCVVCGTVN